MSTKPTADAIQNEVQNAQDAQSARKGGKCVSAYSIHPLLEAKTRNQVIAKATIMTVSKYVNILRQKLKSLQIGIQRRDA